MLFWRTIRYLSLLDVNRFTYVRGDPNNMVDPLGLWWWGMGKKNYKKHRVREKECCENEASAIAEERRCRTAIAGDAGSRAVSATIYGLAETAIGACLVYGGLKWGAVAVAGTLGAGIAPAIVVGIGLGFLGKALFDYARVGLISRAEGKAIKEYCDCSIYQPK